MELDAAQKRVLELREQIDYHSRRYYDEDAPEIEDDEFDALTRELRELEAAYPQLITPDSYTQKVHGEVSNLFSPVQHEVPMASLQDVFSLEELREFHDRLYGLYCRDFSGDVPVLHHMRELWNYFSRSFRETDTLLRQVRKAGDCRAYETAVRQFFYDAELSH